MSAYGLGPFPGTSIPAAADVIISETGSHPHLPQLPQRGIGSSQVARTASILESLRVDRGPRSWVLSDRAQLSTRRLWDQLEQDLDECEQVWGSTLPRLKVQFLGPWSLAAAVELSSGHKVLSDSGARTDLREALVEGINRHVAKLSARFHTQVSVQLDEPLLAEISAGLPGATDFHPLRPIHVKDLAEGLSVMKQQLPVENLSLNLTGTNPLWELVSQTEIPTVHIDLADIRGTEQLDGCGEAIGRGTRVGLNLPARGEPRDAARAIARLWDELGHDRHLLLSHVDVHPAMAAFSDELGAARAYRFAVHVQEILNEAAGDL